MMKIYEISVDGCHDSTTILLTLSDEEAATIKKVAEQISEKSTYGCQPVMSIVELTEG